MVKHLNICVKSELSDHRDCAISVPHICLGLFFFPFNKCYHPPAFILFYSALEWRIIKTTLLLLSSSWCNISYCIELCWAIGISHRLHSIIIHVSPTQCHLHMCISKKLTLSKGIVLKLLLGLRSLSCSTAYILWNSCPNEHADPASSTQAIFTLCREWLNH